MSKKKTVKKATKKKKAGFIPLKKCLLVSYVNHPMELIYDGENMIISPNGKKFIQNKKLLGAIPKGIKIR